MTKGKTTKQKTKEPMEEFIDKLNERFQEMDKDIKLAVDTARATGPIMSELAKHISALDLNTTLMIKYLKEKDGADIKDILSMTGETTESFKAYLTELRSAYALVNDMYRKVLTEVGDTEKAEEKKDDAITDTVPSEEKE